jgi:3-methylcrotonyl-CoA carboxylase alpha subunit
MIAKLIVWGGDRRAALRRLRSALAAYQVAGVATNIEFLHRLVGHHAFAEADLDTGLIARNQHALLPAPTLDDDSLSAAALAEVVRIRSDAEAAARTSAEPHSPWHVIGSWWLNHTNPIDLSFAFGEKTHPINVIPVSDGYRVKIGAHTRTAAARANGADLEIAIDGRRFRATVATRRDERTVFSNGSTRRLALVDPRNPPPADDIGSGHLLAPMSGTIIAVNVKAGDPVEKGAPLLILEAMKMEHTICAPGNGVVEQVFFRSGDQVREGAELVSLGKT